MNETKKYSPRDKKTTTFSMRLKIYLAIVALHGYH
jgi:hypothetical protein